jgi:hypothetical protein
MISNFPIVSTEEEFISSKQGHYRDLWTEIIINAPPAVVRAKCLDFENKPSWDPFYRKTEVIKGRLDDLDTKPTIALTLDVKLNGKEMKLPLTPVITKNDEEGLIWGMNIARGCFYKADHVHLFLPMDDGKATRLVNYERFSGFLKYLMDESSLAKPFNASNAALKKVCEEAN